VDWQALSGVAIAVCSPAPGTLRSDGGKAEPSDSGLSLSLETLEPNKPGKREALLGVNRRGRPINVTENLLDMIYRVVAEHGALGVGLLNSRVRIDTLLVSPGPYHVAQVSEAALTF
jgi:hypothetical protein